MRLYQQAIYAVKLILKKSINNTKYWKNLDPPSVFDSNCFTALEIQSKDLVWDDNGLFKLKLSEEENCEGTSICNSKLQKETLY